MKKSLYLSIFIFLFLSCEKWNLKEESFIQITSTKVVDIDINQVSVESEVKGIINEVLIQHGHIWSISNEEPTIQLKDGKDDLGERDTDGIFSSQLTKLEVDTIYYLRAFAQIGDRVFYGNAIPFTTGNIKVTTDTLEYTDARAATLYGNLCCVQQDITIDQHGFCWSSYNEEPTLADEYVQLGKPEINGSFSGTITGLKDSTLYYYRSFVKTEFGSKVIYGEVKTWTSNLNDIWERKKNFPVGNDFLFKAFSYEGKGYVYANNRLRIYDPNDNTWSSSPVKPGPSIRRPVVFTIGDYAYFMIGSESNNPIGNTCCRYDLVNAQWEDLPPFPGVARFGSVGYAPGNGKGYIGLGDITNYTDDDLYDFWEYDPNASPEWQLLQAFPGAGTTDWKLSFVIDGKGYIGGGLGTGLENLYLYDHETNNWVEKNTLPGGESVQAASFTIGQTAYIGTGQSSGNSFSKTFWAYDHINDSWTAISDLDGSSRWGAFGFAIGNKGYVGGGGNPSTYLVDFWEYKPTVD